eukprot:374365-Karenia_brevis.AAC.1
MFVQLPAGRPKLTEESGSELGGLGFMTCGMLSKSAFTNFVEEVAWQLCTCCRGAMALPRAI